MEPFATNRPQNYARSSTAPIRPTQEYMHSATQAVKENAQR